MQNLTPFIHIACLQSKWLENTLYIQEVITFLGDKNIFHETSTANNSMQQQQGRSSLHGGNYNLPCEDIIFNNSLLSTIQLLIF